MLKCCASSCSTSAEGVSDVTVPSQTVKQHICSHTLPIVKFIILPWQRNRHLKELLQLTYSHYWMKYLPEIFTRGLYNLVLAFPISTLWIMYQQAVLTSYLMGPFQLGRSAGCCPST